MHCFNIAEQICTNNLNLAYEQKNIYGRLTRLPLVIICAFTFNTTVMAWGPEGHAIAGRLALQFVNDDVRKNVLAILGDVPIDTTANWIDTMKSNADYDFMRSWHYLDFDKGEVYVPTNQDNILNRLILTYHELQHKKILCDEQIRKILLIL